MIFVMNSKTTFCDFAFLTDLKSYADVGQTLWANRKTARKYHRDPACTLIISDLLNLVRLLPY